MAELVLGRLKFFWKGTWTPTTEYIKDDVVSYGGKMYVAVQNHTSNASSTDFNLDRGYGYWEQMLDGFTWRGDWQASTFYRVNDIVKYGPVIYLNTQDHTSSSLWADNANRFTKYVEGTTAYGVWNPTTLYPEGAIVTYGGSVYISTSEVGPDTSTDVAPTNADYWLKLVGGLEFEGEWNINTDYQVGDIVLYAGDEYIAVQDSTGEFPTTIDNGLNTTYWIQFGRGFRNRGHWGTNVQYHPGDMAQYGAITYRAKVSNRGQVPNTLATNQTYNITVEATLNGGIYLVDGVPQASLELVRGNTYTFNVDAVSHPFYIATSDNGATGYANEYTDGVTNSRVESGTLTFVVPNDAPDYLYYACGAHEKMGAPIVIATAGSVTNDDYWEFVSGGFQYRGDWNVTTRYYVGDVVNYSGIAYVCKLTTAGIPPSAVSQWSRLADGTKFRGDWASATEYFPGDLAILGGHVWRCKVESQTYVPTEDSTRWEVYVKGVKYNSTYDGATRYYEGDIVNYGGSLWRVKEGRNPPAGTLPTVSAEWDKFLPGLKWRGAWDAGVAYKLDEVVEYAQSSYICVNDNITGVIPDTDNGTNWQLVAQGDSNAVLTTRGDIIIRDSNNVTRLPIGPSGSYLYSDGLDVKWGFQTPQNEYYVALTGDDTADGRTPATAWRTISHACEATYNLGQVKINLTAGTFEEICPMKVGRNVVVEGNGLGAVTISPNNSVVSKDGSTPNANSDIFQLNNGSRLRNIVFRGFGAGAVCTALDPGTGPNDTSVWITSQSPYVQNCTSFTPEGTGLKVDGGLHNGGYKSIVANDWTQLNSDGTGIHVLNDGRTELVSVYTYYCNVGYLAESGGKIRAVVGSSAYGEYGAIARGYSQNERPLGGNIQLPDETINSLVTFDAGADTVVWNDAVADSVNNVYFIGTRGSGASRRALVVGYSGSGSITLQTELGPVSGSGWTTGETIAVQGSSLYIGGSHNDGTTTRGMIHKMTTAGATNYVKSYNNTDVFKGIITDDDEYVYAVGNHSSAGVAVVKINAAGINQWERTVGTSTWTATCCDYTGARIGSTPYPTDTQDRLYITANDSSNNRAYVVKMDTLGIVAEDWYVENAELYSCFLDRDSGDGHSLYLAGASTEATTQAITMRWTLTGTIQWQHKTTGSSAAAGHKIYGIGNRVLVAGELGPDGFVQLFDNNGNRITQNTLNDSGNATTQVLKFIKLDGVNVVFGGDSAGDGVYANFGLISGPSIQAGTLTNFTWNASATGTDNAYFQGNNTASITQSNVALTQNSITTWTNSVSGHSNVEEDTRAGFGSIGNGVNWRITNLARKPKEGSVIQITGNDETYFCIGVSNFVENLGVTQDNSPDSYQLLTLNKDFIQDEVIGWQNDQIANATAGSIWENFTYDQAKCERDVGLIIDALATDLDSTPSANLTAGGQNDQTVEAALSYWYGATLEQQYSYVAGQEPQTVAGLNYMKALLSDVLNQTTPASIYSGTPQVTNGGLTAEANTLTFMEDRVDIITNVILNGPDVAPAINASGTCDIAIDPPITSVTIPQDNESLVFREAFSQVRMTGHDFLDIGSGGFADTNYPVIIQEDYTQQPDQERETFEETGGRVFYVTTDQDGNFRVGNYFKVEQATGRATLSSEEFDLSGLNELQLGSVKAGRQGATIDEFSTDETMSDVSDTSVPTERAVVLYTAVGGAGNLVHTTDDETIQGLKNFQDVRGIQVPGGTTGQRSGSPQNGMFRYNSDIGQFEVYTTPPGGAGNWGPLGSGGVLDTDRNTGMEVERTSNDNTIRFFNNGDDTVQIESDGTLSFIPEGDADGIYGKFKLPQIAEADLPTASNYEGYLFYVTDQNSVYYSDGALWIDIAEQPPEAQSASTQQIDPAQNNTITINGNNFINKPTVRIDSFTVPAGQVTYVSTTQLSVLINAGDLSSGGPYSIYITNPSGLQSQLLNYLTVNGAPTWNTGSGSIGTFYEGVSVNVNATVTDPEGDTITYSVVSDTSNIFTQNGGFLTLNASTGNISGTFPSVGSNTTYNFTLRATDNAPTPNTTDRAFSLTNTNNQAPTWNTGAGQVTSTTTYSGQTVNTSVTATDPESQGITYTIVSGSLPPGLSLNSGTGAITGSPTDGQHPLGAASSTYNFTVRATDGSAIPNTIDRAFSILVNVPYKWRINVNRAIIGGGYIGSSIWSLQTVINHNDNGGNGSLFNAGPSFPFATRYGAWSQDLTHSYDWACQQGSGLHAKAAFSNNAMVSVAGGPRTSDAPNSAKIYGDDNSSPGYWVLSTGGHDQYTYSNNSWSSGFTGAQGGTNFFAGVYDEVYMWSMAQGNQHRRIQFSNQATSGLPGSPYTSSHPKACQDKEGRSWWTRPNSTNIDRWQNSSNSWVSGVSNQPAQGSEDNGASGQGHGFLQAGWGNGGPWGGQHPYGRRVDFSTNAVARQSTVDSQGVGGQASGSTGWGQF